MEILVFENPNEVDILPYYFSWTEDPVQSPKLLNYVWFTNLNTGRVSLTKDVCVNTLMFEL